MKNIYLNILGLKNFDDIDLTLLHDDIDKIQVGYNSIFYEPFLNLKRKIFAEESKRKRSKYVWVQFEAYWSGYTSSQSKIVGRHFRKIEKSIAEKLPSFFSHHFSDNTTNDWSVSMVSVRGKDEGGYSQQVDEFLSEKMLVR